MRETTKGFGREKTFLSRETMCSGEGGRRGKVHLRGTVIANKGNNFPRPKHRKGTYRDFPGGGRLFVERNGLQKGQGGGRRSPGTRKKYCQKLAPGILRTRYKNLYAQYAFHECSTKRTRFLQERQLQEVVRYHSGTAVQRGAGNAGEVSGETFSCGSSSFLLLVRRKKKRLGGLKSAEIERERGKVILSLQHHSPTVTVLFAQWGVPGRKIYLPVRNGPCPSSRNRKENIEQE